MSRHKTMKDICQLVNCEDYVGFRLTIDDDTIDMIREHLPTLYDMFAEREQTFQDLKNLFEPFKIEKDED